MNTSMIDRFEQGGTKLRESLRGLVDSDLKAFPVPGTWSIQQLVIHLQDAELVAVDRMKRVIAEEKPLLVGFDENKFTEKLEYNRQNVVDAATVVELARKNLAIVLRTLPETAWSRFGIHTERGKMTLAEILEVYTNHLERHLKFLYEKRTALGKPL